MILIYSYHSQSHPFHYRSHCHLFRTFQFYLSKRFTPSQGSFISGRSKERINLPSSSNKLNADCFLLSSRFISFTAFSSSVLGFSPSITVKFQANSICLNVI